MYLYHEYQPALRKEVEETIRRSKDANLEVKVYGQGGMLGQKFDREVVEKYVQEVDDVPLLRSVIDILHGAHDIVYANLGDQRLARNPALDRALASPNIAGIPLSRIRGSGNVYLVVTGTFHRIAEQNGTTVFLAPYGEREDPLNRPTPPLVRMECTQRLR